MSDLLQEVDELMRRERMEALWKDYGGYVIAFVIGVIVMTGIISGYKSWNHHVLEQQTATAMELQQASDYPQNILDDQDLKLRPGLRGMTLISAAAALLAQDRTEEAKALYQRAANDKKIPDDLRHLAILMDVRLNGAPENQDEAKNILSRLQSIFSDKKSPWATHARLEAAVIAANSLGDYAGARAHLNAVQDTPDLPESLYTRARALDHVYALKQSSNASTPATPDSKS